MGNLRRRQCTLYSYWLMPDLDAHVGLAVGDQGDPLQQAGGLEGEPQL